MQSPAGPSSEIFASPRGSSTSIAFECLELKWESKDDGHLMAIFFPALENPSNMEENDASPEKKQRIFHPPTFIAKSAVCLNDILCLKKRPMEQHMLVHSHCDVKADDI